LDTSTFANSEATGLVPSDRGNGKIVHGRLGVKEKALKYILRWRRALASNSSKVPCGEKKGKLKEKARMVVRAHCRCVSDAVAKTA
jgi:hypothetical protein